jgi:hypothetical protein
MPASIAVTRARYTVMLRAVLAFLQRAYKGTLLCRLAARSAAIVRGGEHNTSNETNRNVQEPHMHAVALPILTFAQLTATIRRTVAASSNLQQ